MIFIRQYSRAGSGHAGGSRIEFEGPLGGGLALFKFRDKGLLGDFAKSRLVASPCLSPIRSSSPESTRVNACDVSLRL